MKRNIVSIITCMLICAGCGIKARETGAVTPTMAIITATMPPTQTVIPSSTPLPPASQPSPTPVPVSGTTSTSINVRSAPSTASESIGIIPANTVVQIVGKDPGENWWQILYPEAGQAQDGKGWVTAQYVTTAGKPEVPVVGGVGTNPENGNVAVIQQKINIRSGPGTGFNSIGALNPQDVVSLIGKDANGAWLQIEFAPGPDGKGWINAAFTQAQGVENLPIVTEAGQVIGTGTPESTQPPPSPTIVPAPMDNDTMEQPLANVIFEPLGAQTLIYNGDVSAPAGDAQDWIKFETYGNSILLEITCNVSASLSADMLTENKIIRGNILCGENVNISVSPGSYYLIHIQATNSSDGLQYTNYTLSLKANFQ